MILESLRNNGYAICPDFVSAEICSRLRADLEQRFAGGEFRRAGVGSGATAADEVRHDHILWLNEEPYWLMNLRNTLNQELFLGLQRFEGHYARYPAGGFYKSHRDNLSGKDTRIVSLILYLNADWREADGGELQLDLLSGVIRIPPRAGTLVCFLSREIDHQVLECNQPRISFTGWYHCTSRASPL